MQYWCQFQNPKNSPQEGLLIIKILKVKFRKEKKPENFSLIRNNISHPKWNGQIRGSPPTSNLRG